MKRKIIITWWAWFIWSNFLNKYVLKEKEVDFINIDFLTYAWKLENISDDVKNAENYFFEKVDIKDLKSLEKVYEKFAPTDIIHFAAESHVDNSIETPIIFTQTNVIWTQNLLECHKKYWLKRFHYISTDEVYWDILEWSFSENDVLNPSNPYSASKVWAEMLVKAYSRTYWIDFVITRSSNNFGPNQDKEKLIPHFIDLLKNDKKVTLYWNWENIRDWIYVEDNIDATWEVFLKAPSKSIYNIWWDNHISNIAITKIILSQMWKDLSYLWFVKDRLWHDFRYAINTTKIEKELWFKPKIDFLEWIKKTIRFYL